MNLSLARTKESVKRKVNSKKTAAQRFKAKFVGENLMDKETFSTRKLGLHASDAAKPLMTAKPFRLQEKGSFGPK